MIPAAGRGRKELPLLRQGKTRQREGKLLEGRAAREGRLAAGRAGANPSHAISFLSDLWQEAEAGGTLCARRASPPRGRAFPAGDRRRKEPRVPWQEAASSAGGDGRAAGEMPAARGRRIKIKERRGWKGPGSSRHKHKPHCGLVSHPRGSSDSRRQAGDGDGISPGSAWSEPGDPPWPRRAEGN